MRDLERTWNNKFNYPYVFFNDQPFTEEFKRGTQAVTKAKCHYGMVTLFCLQSRPPIPLTILDLQNWCQRITGMFRVG